MWRRPSRLSLRGTRRELGDAVAMVKFDVYGIERMLKWDQLICTDLRGHGYCAVCGRFPYVRTDPVQRRRGDHALLPQ